jgi:hypothetical protein
MFTNFGTVNVNSYSNKQIKKIEIMKTTKNMNQIVKVSIASLAMFMVLALTPAQAVNGNNGMLRKSDIQAATIRIETLNLQIEKAVKYNAPDVLENTTGFELEAAGCRLENVAASAEKLARYIAPEIGDVTEDYEMIGIIASLDQVNSQIEQLIKYTVPADVE